MNSSLRADLARLGPIRAVDRVSSGSPAVFVLRQIRAVSLRQWMVRWLLPGAA